MKSELEATFQKADRMARNLAELKHAIYDIKSSNQSDETMLNALRDLLSESIEELASEISDIDATLASVERMEKVA